MIQINAKDALYIKQKSLSIDIREELIQRHSYMFYEEKSCQQCEFLPERHTEVCNQCAAFKGGSILSQEVLVGKNKYLKVPIGDENGLKRILTNNRLDFKVKEYFPETSMSRKIKFLGTLKDYQVEAKNSIIRYKRGVIKAPPRSGKTVLSTAAICEIGQKTIILASQRDWLDGFLETFIGSSTQTPLTNCKKEQIGYARKYDDFLKYDICLVTVQTFYSEKGQKLLKKIKNLFTAIIIDECFPAGTIVTTNKGPVPIEIIAKNPFNYKALSFNHNTGDWEYRQVTNSFPKHTRKRLLKIITEGGTFTCTEDHRVWSEDRQEYIRAKDLRYGENLKQFKS